MMKYYLTDITCLSNLSLEYLFLYFINLKKKTNIHNDWTAILPLFKVHISLKWIAQTFLDLYLSCRDKILSAVQRFRPTMSKEN